MRPSLTRERVERSALQADPGFIWLGSVNDPSGHADELRGFLRAQERAGHEPALAEITWTDTKAGLGPEDSLMIARQKSRKKPNPALAVHQYLPFTGQPSVGGAVNVARAMFESDTMPMQWLEPLLAREEVWVPCRFNVETFVRGGLPESKLRVVGGTLDFDLFDPGVEPYPLDVPEGHFTFLTNFDFSERKGWRQLLLGWSSAFDAGDPVCLVLKTGSYYKKDGYVRERINAFIRDEFGAGARERLAPIVFLTETLPTADLPRLYAAADAYVLPSRGEGWGRPYMEAMAMGLPTVASNWSGNTEFMTPETSWLVGGELVPVPDDAELFNPLYKGHRWFEPDPDSLAEVLRDIAADPDAARAKAARARPDLIERFGPEATAARLAELGHEAIERHLERVRRPARLAVRGEFGSNASLAVINDSLGDALEESGHRVHRQPRHAAVLTDDCPTMSHSWPPKFTPGSAGPTIVTLPWEHGAPPREWVEHANGLADRVWVPSAYVRDGYVAGGMAPGIVEVVPNPVDTERFTPEGPAYPLEREAACVFLFVGGTIWRKGIDLLLEAWTKAFTPGDDVLLVIKDFGADEHYRGYTQQDGIRRLADGGRCAAIEYIDRHLSHEQLPALYRAADAAVLPYRGEGFCLPALEAMACGVPVLHNENGPTSEFVGEECGWPLPSRRVPLPPESKLPPLAIPGWVHDVDVDALAERLRSVAADPAAREAKGRAGRARAVEHHTPQAIAQIAERSLDTLEAEALPLARKIAPAEIEARDVLVVYAPDWSDEDAWAQALVRWAAAVSADAPVTLALFLPENDPSTLAARILARLAKSGHGEDTLPDLALCEPGAVKLESLVAAADAVLLDERHEAAAPPALVRRARRVLRAEPAELEAFAGVTCGGSPFMPWQERSARPHRCVFAGDGSGSSAEAAQVVLGAAELLPEVEFDLVGCSALELDVPANVTMHESLSGEILAAAKLAVNPLRAPAPHTSVEKYVAAGLPVLTSPAGADGWDAELVERFLLVEPDGGQLAEAIADSLEWDWSAPVDEARRLAERR